MKVSDEIKTIPKNQELIRWAAARMSAVKTIVTQYRGLDVWEFIFIDGSKFVQRVYY